MIYRQTSLGSDGLNLSIRSGEATLFPKEEAPAVKVVGLEFGVDDAVWREAGALFPGIARYRNEGIVDRRTTFVTAPALAILLAAPLLTR